MGLSSEKLQELTEEVNARYEEFGKPLIFPPLTPGAVRVAYDAIGEWERKQNTAALEDHANAYNNAYERGYEHGYAEAERVTKPVHAPDDDGPDPDALAADWPAMPDLADGVDHFAEHPVAGEPELAPSVPEADAPDTGDVAWDWEDTAANLAALSEPEPEAPPKSDVRSERVADPKLATALELPSNGHAPALSAQAAATLGPEHTVVTPLDKPIGRARDPLPDPDVARLRLAKAVAEAGAVERLASALKAPRTLAEVDAELDAQVASVWGDDTDDDDDANNVQPKRVRDFKQERESRGEYKRKPSPAKPMASKRTMQPDRDQLIKELKRQSMGGVAPSQTFFDSAKPATWGTAQAQCRRLGASWMELVREAGLKPSPTGAAAHQPQAMLRAG